MRDAPHVKMTKRQFFIARRKALRRAKSALDDLRIGCQMLKGIQWYVQVEQIDNALKDIEEILRGK